MHSRATYLAKLGIEMLYPPSGKVWTIVTAVAGIFLSLYAIKKLHFHGRWKKRQIVHQLRLRAQKRRQEREKNLAKLVEKLADEAGVLLTPERQQIVSLSPTELLQMLKRKTLTAVQVLHAFQAKAIEVTKKSNCVVSFLDEAEEWAAELDRRDQVELLPLHGLPVSIKENWAIANHDITLGLAKNLNQPMTEDSANVAAIKQIGGVPFCITNVPQTMLSFGGSNPIYGTTTHPTHPDRTPGGSSSGEACLIASGGSVLGLGSDIGGSVRIPSHFCGVFGYKPTGGRFSGHGKKSVTAGCPGLTSTAGLMGADAEIIITAARELFKDGWMSSLDPLVVPLPWNEQIFKRQKLRIGYWESSSTIFPAIPACRRAVLEAARAMESAGHEIVPFQLNSREEKECFELQAKLALAEGGRAFSRALENEEVSDSIQKYLDVTTTPRWLRLLLKPIKQQFTNHNPALGATKSHELWDTLHAADVFARKLIGRWRKAKIDIWMTPAHTTVAMEDKLTATLIFTAYYNAMFNVLNFPAGVVPVTKVTSEDEETLRSDYNTHGDVVLNMIKEAAYGSTGLPVGVQLVGLPWQDELVLHTMQVLASVLQSRE